MAAGVRAYSDKEMTTFVGQTHVDNLDKFYGLMRDMVLNPGWRAADFARVRDEPSTPCACLCAATTTRNWPRKNSTT